MNLIKLTSLEKVFRLVLKLTHYFILSLLFIFSNVVASTANDHKGKYYESLSKDWRSIFPDGNRNAAGQNFTNIFQINIRIFQSLKNTINIIVLSQDL